VVHGAPAEFKCDSCVRRVVRHYPTVSRRLAANSAANRCARNRASGCCRRPKRPRRSRAPCCRQSLVSLGYRTRRTAGQVKPGDRSREFRVACRCRALFGPTPGFRTPQRAAGRAARHTISRKAGSSRSDVSQAR
jgi:hypothetical protein